MALPTEEQLSHAQDIADKLGKVISPEILSSGLILSMWAKSNAGKIKESAELCSKA